MLRDLLSHLVERLMSDFAGAVASRMVPDYYDPPATCLALAKRYADGWQVLRLGDSTVLTQNDRNLTRHPLPPTDLAELEAELRRNAQVRRQAGPVDFKELLQNSHRQHFENRRCRNTPGSYSVLVADKSALAIPEIIHLGAPDRILLCTDGFYRAVDTYHLYEDKVLMEACSKDGGVQDVLSEIRAVEAADPHCRTHLRFKPSDDATAVMLQNTLEAGASIR